MTERVWLADVLAEQRRHRGPSCLDRSLGDGYLYAHNPTFRRLRDVAWALGYGATLEDVGDYFTFPLLSLDDLLRQRRLPYADNLSPLVRLEAQRPRHFHLGDLEIAPRPNYLMHESAHAIAFDALYGPDADVTRALSDHDRIVHLLLGEAFAMSAEYLARCAVGESSTHRWLFGLSSYCQACNKRRRVATMIGKLGFRTTAWLLMASFLYFNFGRDRIRRRHVDAMLASPLAERSPRGEVRRKRLRKTLSAVITVNPAFRDATTPLFLGKLGYPRALDAYLAPDPLARVSDDQCFQEGARDLVTILEAGLRGPFSTPALRRVSSRTAEGGALRRAG